LPKFATVAGSDDISDRAARWNLTNLDDRTQQIELRPKLLTSDLRVRPQAAIHGIDIALVPEQMASAPLNERLLNKCCRDGHVMAVR
jgi:hypothetical protein